MGLDSARDMLQDLHCTVSGQIEQLFGLWYIRGIVVESGRKRKGKDIRRWLVLVRGSEGEVLGE